MQNRFDVIVVGGGHAGIEAAYAAAKMGAQTLLLTLDLDKIASMPCNPSVGGLGKGHIVFEVSALGGLMPQLCSTTYLQARMLNTSKGPAVQGLRLQIDKYEYSRAAKKALLETPNLTIISAMTKELLTEDEIRSARPFDASTSSAVNASTLFEAPLGLSESASRSLRANGDEEQELGGTKKIIGVRADDGREFFAPSVVVTTGTFMKGVVHIGRTRYKAGRRGEAASYGLSDSIAQAMGVELKRLKTGTPPRLLRSSLDFSKFTAQEDQPLDYLYEFDHFPVTDKMACFIAHTNEKTHEIIRDNLHLSALYSGNIKGVGPRYCPSIEDKIGRFPDKTGHHVFIEPESLEIEEVYPAGLSTSLPLEVQEAYIKSMVGCENAVIAKAGYAIEYDFIQPNNLTHTLEAKTVSGLFLAGQLNGTTGYEEAAGQGIVAGINAALKAAGKERFVLHRHESYIGVMIDDMVTLGVDEPYRMFTARAERRLLLRQDNVFLRLMPYGHKLGIISDELFARFLEEKEIIETSVRLIKAAGLKSQLFQLFFSLEFTPEIRAQAKALLETLLEGKVVSSRALLGIHAEIRYEGYIKKENIEVEKMQKYQQLQLPEDLDFKKISGISFELQQKLSQFKPKTIAQAQLIPGMTPAAISVLIFQTREVRRSVERELKGEERE